MTSVINNENANILLFPNKEFNNKHQQGKNYPKIYQKQTAKGLSVLDQNIPYVEKNPLKEQKINKVPIQKNNVIITEMDILPLSQEKDKDKIIKEDIVLTSPNFSSDKIESESEYKQLSTLISEAHKALINLDINIEKMYRKRESDNLLINEGESSYKYNKLLEDTIFKIPPNFLEKHNISPYIRTKMIDWMIEVLSVFDSSDETFFLSVNVFDLFLYKAKSVYRNDQVHLIGMAAMFIASKFQEIWPITLNNFVHKIGHEQFTPKEIKDMECAILKVLDLDCLVSTSVYDFCKTYFYDFYYNNKSLITTKEDVKIYKYIKYTSIYLNKLVLHYEFFYSENCSMKAIACIVTSIKIVGDGLNGKLTMKTKGIYNDWMLFLIEQGGFNKEKVEILAKKIYTAYQHYQTSKSISRNLNRFFPLEYNL